MRWERNGGGVSSATGDGVDWPIVVWRWVSWETNQNISIEKKKRKRKGRGKKKKWKEESRRKWEKEGVGRVAVGFFPLGDGCVWEWRKYAERNGKKKKKKNEGKKLEEMWVGNKKKN